jgi:hypothetical protein
MNEPTDGFFSTLLGMIGLTCMTAAVIIIVLDADPTIPQANAIPLRHAYWSGLCGLACLLGCITTSKAKRAAAWRPAFR